MTTTWSAERVSDGETLVGQTAMVLMGSSSGRLIPPPAGKQRVATFVFGLAFIAGVVIWNVAAGTGNHAVFAAIIPIPVATTVREVRFRQR